MHHNARMWTSQAVVGGAQVRVRRVAQIESFFPWQSRRCKAFQCSLRTSQNCIDNNFHRQGPCRPAGGSIHM